MRKTNPEWVHKIENFLVENLQNIIRRNLIIEEEPVKVVMLQKLQRSGTILETKGLIKIGKKYFPIKITVYSRFIKIKGKTIDIKVPMEEVEVQEEGKG